MEDSTYLNGEVTNRTLSLLKSDVDAHITTLGYLTTYLANDLTITNKELHSIIEPLYGSISTLKKITELIKSKYDAGHSKDNS